MYTDEVLRQFLPSRRLDLLAAAIGRKLIEIERFLGRGPHEFMARGGHPRDFFSRNTGATQLHFDGGLIHSLVVYPSQLSIVVVPDLLVGDDIEPAYQLIDQDQALPALMGCLGRVCEDVRIYIYAEEFPAEEEREAGISYVFADQDELIYCIYFHGELDSGYLLPGAQMPRERVERWYSVSTGQWVST
jgi:hypothetical protein